MQRWIRLFPFGLAIAVSPSLAQTASPSPSQSLPGIDVWQTLNPQPPSSTTGQPGYVSAPGAGQAATAAPTGHVAGNVTLYPSVTGSAFYDDNVFATNLDRRGGWGYIVRPELGFQLNNTGTASLTGGAYVEHRWYTNFASEEQTNGAAAAGATAMYDPDTQVTGRLQYVHAHEDRGSAESQFQQFAKPIAYDQIDGAAAVNKRFGRWWTSVGAAALWLNYDDADFAGFTISQAYRSGNIVRVPVRVGYVVAPLTSVFVEGSYNSRDFDVGTFSSQGYRLVGGVLLEPGPGARVKGEAFAGYMNQDYSGSGFQTVSTWTYGASMAFLLTPTVTATLEGRREAREASLSGGVLLGAPGDGISVVQTVAAARVDFLIRPDVTIGGGASYLQDEYLGVGNDHAWSPLVSVKWFVNPALTLAADYRNVSYETGVPGTTEYYRNVYMISAHLKL